MDDQSVALPNIFMTNELSDDCEAVGRMLLTAKRRAILVWQLQAHPDSQRRNSRPIRLPRHDQMQPRTERIALGIQRLGGPTFRLYCITSGYAV